MAKPILCLSHRSVAWAEISMGYPANLWEENKAQSLLLDVTNFGKIIHEAIINIPHVIFVYVISGGFHNREPIP